MKNLPVKIIVHHTADPNAGPQVENVNEWHRQRNFNKSILGWFVGYHFFIERNGKIIQCRVDDEHGNHTQGENFSSIGIGLAGNFDYQSPTALQIQSLVKIIGELIKKWGIKASEIYPHRKFKPTSCFGLILPDNWAKEQYRIFLHNKLLTALIALKGLLEKLILLKWKTLKHSN